MVEYERYALLVRMDTTGEVVVVDRIQALHFGHSSGMSVGLVLVLIRVSSMCFLF